MKSVLMKVDSIYWNADVKMSGVFTIINFLGVNNVKHII